VGEWTWSWQISGLWISIFRRVLNVVFFLSGDSPASELYVPTFRNTQSVPSPQVLTTPMKIEQLCVPKRRCIQFKRWGIIQKKVYKLQATLCQHSPELIKITQTFVGMSGARVTAEIYPPPLLFPTCTPFPSVWANLASPLRSSHLLAYFMYNARPSYWSLFPSKISHIFCPSVTVALWLGSSGIISDHVICVFWWCLLLCCSLSFCHSHSSLHYISLFYIPLPLSFQLICSLVNV